MGRNWDTASGQDSFNNLNSGLAGNSVAIACAPVVVNGTDQGIEI